MSWKLLLDSGDVKTHQTSKQELNNIRALIARDLADASIPELSADRRFATAYNAALQAADHCNCLFWIPRICTRGAPQGDV
jgi:hypothetical protein